MRVAVVTPYYQEPRQWMERCLASVRAQTHACDHIVVADGHPQNWLDESGVRHIRLDRSHRDFGNTPRAIGGLLAVSEGYDAVAFLDADNWYAPEHLQQCVELAQQSGADYVAARRLLARADGSVINAKMAEDDDGSLVDTNCFFLCFGAFHSIPRLALMPKTMAMFGDRFFLKSLREEGLREARLDAPTVYYLCTWSSIYRAIGETPPEFAKENLSMEKLGRWLAQLQPSDLTAVKRLTGVQLASLPLRTEG